VQNQENQENQESQKYKKTALTQTQATSILQSIDLLMVEQKLFLDHGLSIDQLAEKLNTQPQ
jgi:hypothetical protein